MSRLSRVGARCCRERQSSGNNKNKYIIAMSKYRRLAIKVSLVLLTLMSLVIVYVVVQEERERLRWKRLYNSTLHLYQTDEVCRDDDGDHVLNCGSCGHCSNVNDIRHYKESAQTLTKTMTLCTMRGFFVDGSSGILKCLRQNSKLTLPCAKCWVGNAECNFKHCSNTCLKHRMMPSFIPSLGRWDDDRLDPCHACDETFCGPGFVACAGANRRRVGIVSDILRDEANEICSKVDWDWIMSQSVHDNIGDDNNNLETTIDNIDGEETHTLGTREDASMDGEL